MNLLGSKERKFSVSYACAEFLWYMLGTNDTTFIKKIAPSYRLYEDRTNFANGAYGPRMLPQLRWVIRELKKLPASRRAVVNIWDHDLQNFESLDLPCTLTLQFLLRDDQLHMITTMRSQDVWLGMPYDVFCFTVIQRLIANELHVDIGSYTHQCGSIHLYAKNELLAHDAIKNDYQSGSLPNDRSSTLTSMCEVALLTLDAIDNVNQNPRPTNVFQRFFFDEVINDYHRRTRLSR